jgi:D-alanine-D-alanine ligase
MRTVVGVLRGGPSSEYDVSLKSGAHVLEVLDREKFDPKDIFVDKNAQWHIQGVPTAPERALRGVDVVFNAMHGQYGEDGQVQRMLDMLNIPYTGSNVLSSALAFNKQRTREAAMSWGVKVPKALVLAQPQSKEELEKAAFNIFRTFPHPAVVKPIIGGSSVGLTIVDNFPTLEGALSKGFDVAPKVLVEEFIKGKEATVGVIDRFRNEKTYALMPIEHGGGVEHVPGYFSTEEKKSLTDLARKIHQGLSLSHYSRSDFIVGKRGIYFLEVNTLPGLTKDSFLPKALQAVGAKMSHFVEHVLDLARGKKKKIAQL